MFPLPGFIFFQATKRGNIRQAQLGILIVGTDVPEPGRLSNIRFCTALPGCYRQNGFYGSTTAAPYHSNC